MALSAMYTAEIYLEVPSIIDWAIQSMINVGFYARIYIIGHDQMWTKICFLGCNPMVRGP